MDDLDDHLAGGDRLCHRRPGGLFGHPLDEIAGNGKAYVRLQKRGANFAERGDDVSLGQRAGLGETVEHATKAF